MSQLGIWSITPDGPVRSARVRIGLERYLQDWIERDPRMLPDDLTIVGREVTLGEHRLDLLAISRTGQWVVIELKEGELYRQTLMQVLDYTAKVAAMPADDLLRKLNRGDDVARGRAAELLAAETGGGDDGAGGTGAGRDVVAMVVGTTVDPGLERMASFLGSYAVPIRVVTFDVFETAGGGRLLVREVEDAVETAEPRARARTTYSVAAVRELAEGMGSGGLLDEVIEAGRDLGLYVRPWQQSITLTPPDRGKRTLFHVRPVAGGRLQMGWFPENLTDLYGLSQADVEETVGRFRLWGVFAEGEVRELIGAIAELMRRTQGLEGGTLGP
ncbi:MAG: hypothetical protein IT332_13185 [Ardenticatenales bacterium]|nr:hypothetical protein [Ardenticatenales bacterium]